jgi:hypothetical protein
MINTLGVPSYDDHHPGDGSRQPADPPDSGTGDAVRHLTFVTLGVGVVLTTFLAVAGIVFGDFGEGLGKAIASSMALFAYGLLALIGGVYRYERRPSPTLANASVITAIFGLGLGVIAIWTDFSVTAYKFAWVGFIVAFATAHASFLQARRRSNDPRLVGAVLLTTNIFIALAACLLSIFVLAIEDVGKGFAILVVSVLLIDLMLNVLVPIARHASPTRDRQSEAAPPIRTPVHGPDADYGI